MRPQLTQDVFFTVVEHAPLVAIDFILRNGDGAVLLGQRVNRPAKGYWFTPGGRIYKGETLRGAFNAIAMAEFGREFEFDQALLLGAFEHFYDDSASNKPGVGTHYVVIAYDVRARDLNVEALPVGQHNAWRWFEIDELMSRPDVHQNVKNYFL